MTVNTYTSAGAKASTKATLNDSIFKLEVKNHDLIRQVYDAYLADVRSNAAVTKTRGLIRGGGRKPWKQKGTGRARFGSIRTPLWRGGGTVFGPTGLENHKLDINKKAKAKAMKQALSVMAAAEKVAVITDLPSTGKTSDAAKLVKKIATTDKVIFVTDSIKDAERQALNNLAGVQIYTANYLNVYRVINAGLVVFTKDGLKALEERLGDA